jgi:hypothetical protein
MDKTVQFQRIIYLKHILAHITGKKIVNPLHEMKQLLLSYVILRLAGGIFLVQVCRDRPYSVSSVSLGIDPGYSLSPQTKNNVVKYYYCSSPMKYEISSSTPAGLMTHCKCYIDLPFPHHQTGVG